MSKPILIYSRNSGKKPESVARGTRLAQTTPDPELRRPQWLGVAFTELSVWLAIVALIAVCLVLGAL